MELSPGEEGYQPLSGCREQCIVISVGLSYPYIIQPESHTTGLPCWVHKEMAAGLFHPLLSLSPKVKF